MALLISEMMEIFLALSQMQQVNQVLFCMRLVVQAQMIFLQYLVQQMEQQDFWLMMLQAQVQI